MAELNATVRVTGGAEALGRWRLPRRSSTTLGRAKGSAIQLRGQWVPGRLAVLEPQGFGWLMRNGYSTRVVVRGPGLRGARFEPGGVAALIAGEWEIHWALDQSLRAEVSINKAPAPADLPWALNPTIPVHDQQHGTAYAADRQMFSQAELHLLAVLFAYEFEAVTPPRNICQAAAEALSLTSSQVKNSANTVRRRINKKRHTDLETLEELGFYLVHTARVLSEDDLDP